MSPAALRVTATGFGESPSCAAVQLAAAPSVEPTPPGAWQVVVRARSLHPETAAVEVALIEPGGAAFGFDAPLSTEWSDARAPVNALRPLWETSKPKLDVAHIAELRFTFGSWLFPKDAPKRHGIEIAEVALEPVLPVWSVPVLSRTAPIALFDADRHHVRMQCQVPHRTFVVAGMQPGKNALRIVVDGFGPPPSALSFRNEVMDELDQRREQLAHCDTMVVRARALKPVTNAVEIVLIERDGSCWGTTVPLTTAWQALRVPLSDLRLFTHWAGNPPGRGGEGDHVRPDNLAAVNVGFGAWLYPDHPAESHTVDLESIALPLEGE
jgi:hypothetical protein